MHRRRFLDILAGCFKASLLASVLPTSSAASIGGDKESPPLHYRPLDGRRLRDIAARREHHGDGRFVNPLGLDRSGRLLQVLSWKLFHRNRFEDDLLLQPVVPVHIDWKALTRNDGLSVTFLKHASVMVQDGGQRLLIDPIFTEPFWFIRDFTPLAFEPEAIPAPDHLLITHGHLDHLDSASLKRLPKDTHVVAPPGYGEIFDEAGLTRRSELDWFDHWRGSGFTVTLLPCNHWTMRNPIAGPNLGLWGSYLIQTPSGRTLFISGDTAYFDGFDQLGAEGDIDLAIFNLGAYEPRWFMAGSHINPRETVQALIELNAKKLLITHWGTYQLGDEPVHFPPQHIREEMQRAGLADRLIEWTHGQTVML
jgi:L-ascorbate metabolism protein UlaG (beta-lactamase superfamily)